MAVWRSLGHGSEDRSRRRAAACARDRLRRVRCRRGAPTSRPASRAPAASSSCSTSSSVPDAAHRADPRIQLRHSLAHRAEQPKQSRIGAASARARRRHVRAGSIGSATPRSIVHAKPAGRRDERDGHSLRDLDDERSGQLAANDGTSGSPDGSRRARRAAPSDPTPTPSYRRASRARMSLGRNVARSEDLDATHAKERHAPHDARPPERRREHENSTSDADQPRASGARRATARRRSPAARPRPRLASASASSVIVEPRRAARDPSS